MPVSKRRKGANSKPRRVGLAPQQVSTTRWKATLNGARLQFLKKDPDFPALLKIGRLLNTILFAVQCIGDHMEENTVVDTRQHRRAFFVLGGYLHQGLSVVRSIQGRYLGVPEYEDLRLLVHDSKYKKPREYVKAVRNFAAFHLDEDDKTTREGLSKLKPSWYGLMSGDSEHLLTSYFEFADLIDLGYLVNHFGNGRGWEETSHDIHTTILNFSTELTGASFKFMEYLMQKTNLRDHLKAGFVQAPKSDKKKRLDEEESMEAASAT